VTLTMIVPDADSWDQFVQHRNGHLLQTARWGALKREFGWTDQAVAVGEGDKIVGGALVLYRALPLRVPGSLAYVPRGPVVDWNDRAAVDALMGALDTETKKRRAFALKIEPNGADSAEMRERLTALKFRPAPHVQPLQTILLDITGSEDDILARMSQSTRRKVRTGAKRDIEVRRGAAEDVRSFSSLMQVTGSRNEFGVHTGAYYEKAFALFAPDHAALLMASYQGKDLAGLMVFAYGNTAWYFYGASSNEERERMPTYALQWEAIRWARERGCTIYDLWGIPNEDEATLEAQFQTRNDGLWGVYGFKRGFGGEIVRGTGGWDRAYNPLLYGIYAAVVGKRSAE
jgi:peptidoglycan pentaglycine glycine transferase (the first glycine)